MNLPIRLYRTEEPEAITLAFQTDYTTPEDAVIFEGWMDGSIVVAFVARDGSALVLVCDNINGYLCDTGRVNSAEPSRGWAVRGSPDEHEAEPGTFDCNADRITLNPRLTLV